MTCPRCHFPLPPGARFCSECGAAVTQPVAVRTERRITSVLFGDLVGFTALSESRDAEDVRELLSRYFDTCRQIVERYGGMVEKFIGDAVMAVWGVPTAREDDAERAVRAGLELVAAVAAFGADVGAAGLAQRVGVVTGEVAVSVGAVGQGMVAGDAVNTAARVQAAAEPGTVWVDTQTRSLAAASIDFTATGTHPLKGKADVATLFRAGAVRGGRGGARGTEQVQAPLVARQAELAALRDCFHAAVADGRPRLAVVTGEAGLGKTRLAWELRNYLDGITAPVLWHVGWCPSYGAGLPFAALTAAVRARLGVTPDSPAADVVAALDAGLAGLARDADDRQWLADALGVLLGLTADRQGDREQLFAAWIAWFERLHARAGEPLVWVIEDAHRADDGLLSFVDRLVTVAAAPVVVVLTARPELLSRVPDLPNGPGRTGIALPPLSGDECDRLVRALVEDAAPGVVAALVERVEGNPLYAVETVRSLVDQGLAVTGSARHPGAVQLRADVDPQRLRELADPTSLQVLIASRLDLLGPRERTVLDVAAVLGRSFGRAALAHLLSTDEDNGDGGGDLDAALAALVARDLIRPADTGRYTFGLSVVRQVAYRTQSRRERRTRHLAAAAYAEPLVERDRDLSAVIAQHLRDALGLTPPHDAAASGEIRDRLRTWLERTAARAETLGAPGEAVPAYLEALELTGEPSERLRLRLAAAGAAGASGDHAQALAVLQDVLGTTDTADPADPAAAADAGPDARARATALASVAHRRRGEHERAWTLLAPYTAAGALDGLPALPAARIMREIGAYWAETGRLDEAWAWQERSIPLAEDTGDPREIVRSINNFAITAGNRGHVRIAIGLFRVCVELAREHHLVAEYALPLDNLVAYLTNRDLDAALAANAESLQTGEAAGDTSACWHTAATRLMLLHLAGRDAEFDDVLARPLLLARPPEPDQAVMVTLFRALRAEAGGEPVDSAALFRAARLADTVESTTTAFSLACRALSARLAGDVAGLVRAADAAVRTSVRYCGVDDDVPHLWALAATWLLDAGATEAVAGLLALVETTPATRWSPLLSAQVHRVRGTLAALTGNAGSAAAELRLAVDALTAFGARPDAARAQTVLARLAAG